MPSMTSRLLLVAIAGAGAIVCTAALVSWTAGLLLFDGFLVAALCACLFELRRIRRRLATDRRNAARTREDLHELALRHERIEQKLDRAESRLDALETRAGAVSEARASSTPVVRAPATFIGRAAALPPTRIAREQLLAGLLEVEGRASRRVLILAGSHSSQLADSLLRHGFEPLVARPTLLPALLETGNPHAMIIDRRALSFGPWSGLESSHGFTLLAELLEGITRLRSHQRTVILLGTAPVVDVNTRALETAVSRVIHDPDSPVWVANAPEPGLFAALRGEG
ncbi:MAG: hypothetical protein SO035_06505 [Schaalia hyovaginalis]|nr:hypothetical protein [Schaalia hyovaginalis]